jgi:DNA-binding phage protein
MPRSRSRTCNREPAIKLRDAALDPVLDERGRRRFAAAEALAAGSGGATAVARITGIARSTIDRGLAELRGERPSPPTTMAPLS